MNSVLTYALLGALGFFPYAARSFNIVRNVLDNAVDQECSEFGPSCFPPLVTIYRTALDWCIENGI